MAASWIRSMVANSSNLEVVVLQDLDQGVSEVGDLHALLDTVDQQYGVHVGPDVIQQTRDECCRIDSDSHTRNHCSLLDVVQAYVSTSTCE